MNRIIILTFALFSFQLSAQVELNWILPEESASRSDSSTYLYFDGASYEAHGLPVYSTQIKLPARGKADAVLINEEYAPLSDRELAIFERARHTDIDQVAKIQSSWTTLDGIDYVVCQVFPFRTHPETDRIEKLLSFDLAVERSWNNSGESSSKSSSWASNSVLRDGTWIKVAISKSGMYSLSISGLESMGLAISGAPSSELRMYHNGGGTLPEPVADPRVDDLREASIRVDDGGDGVLHPNDRVYFYAEGPHSIQLSNSEWLTHKYNVYSEESYVFFTRGGTGLRVEKHLWTGGATDTVSVGFDDLLFYELDERNIAGTGREWYGTVFDFTTSKNFEFRFPDRQLNEPVWVRFRGAARASNGSTFFEVKHGNTQISSTQFSASGSLVEFQTGSVEAPYTTSANNLSLDLIYNRSASPSAVGYFDYLSVQARRNWIYSTGGFIARDTRSIASGIVVGYAISNYTPDINIWDVSNPSRPFLPEINGSGQWNAPGDSLRVYAVWKSSDAINLDASTRISSVPNQNLHALDEVDMLIISHPAFMAQSERLAQFHRDHDGLRVEVVHVGQVYNEFSGGTQDVSAIRDLARMLRFRNPNPANQLRYLLLMGDASYDYKNRVANNHNFVPVFESVYSAGMHGSFMTDDYYACLDFNEGKNVVNEKLDISVGRLPVKTQEEANAAVNKIMRYAQSTESFGEWRNRITFVSDDADDDWETMLTRDPERVARRMDTTLPNFNIEKIYLDSYTQQSTSGSQNYPDAHDALFRSVQRGNLVTSYVGHGGEVGWASERVLQLQDINSFDNSIKMPLFVTITCEFTRFDDPERVSAGEQLFLNPNGGAIGLITTTRLVFASPATQLNDSVFQVMFGKVDGKYPTLGEITRNAKNAISSPTGTRFSLIGDPALRLNIPEREIVLDSVNGQAVNAVVDTMKAQSFVTLSGRVLNQTGNTDTGFNGEASVIIFDKPQNRTTNGNDGWGKVSFTQQENVIYRGRVSVISGHWNASFIVPRDINFMPGQGKISLYADNDTWDAAGSDRRFFVGGIGNSPIVDTKGPEIQLYMNDTLFRSGGITDENPLGLAMIFDEAGINVVGSGIGHDIVGILDDKHNEPIRLNPYFTSDLDNFQSGQVEYPFFNLPEGPHKLKVRVWDVFNNESAATIHFVVANSDEIVIDEVFGFPNPFSESTTIQFEHNRAGEELLVRLDVLNLKGELVYTDEQRFIPEGNREERMVWNGRTGSGSEVSAGIYVFRLEVRSLRDGQESVKSERLVYMR